MPYKDAEKRNEYMRLYYKKNLKKRLKQRALCKARREKIKDAKNTIQLTEYKEAKEI